MFQLSIRTMLLAFLLWFIIRGVSGRVTVESSSNCTVFLLIAYQADKNEVILPDVPVFIYQGGANPKPNFKDAVVRLTFFGKQTCVLALCYFGSDDLQSGTSKVSADWTFSSWMKDALRCWPNFVFVFGPKPEIRSFLTGNTSVFDWLRAKEQLNHVLSYKRFVYVFLSKMGSLTACSLVTAAFNQPQTYECIKSSAVGIDVSKTFIHRKTIWYLSFYFMLQTSKLVCRKKAPEYAADAFEHAFQMILCKENSSIIDESGKIGTWTATLEDVFDIKMSQNTRITSYYTELSSHIVFLSCYSKPQLTFYIYVMPFDNKLWIFIFISIGFIFLSIVISKSYQDIEKTTQILFFLLSTLFDDLSTIPLRLYNSSRVRLCLVGWLLTVSMLVSLYSGIISSEITLPTFKTKLENFSEVFCPAHYLQTYFNESDKVKKVTRHYDFWLKKDEPQYTGRELKKNHVNPDCFSFLSLPDQFHRHYADVVDSSGKLRIGYINLNFYDLHDTLIQILTRFVSSTVGDGRSIIRRKASLEPLERVVQTMSYSTRFHPNIDDVDKSVLVQLTSTLNFMEVELVKCKKSIFVGFEEDVNAEHDYLRKNYKRNDFYVAKDTLLHFQKIWVFQDYGSSRIPFYFHQVVASGIIKQVKLWIKYRSFLKRLPGTKVIKEQFQLDDWAPSAINKAMISLFILYGILVLICILTYVAERLIAEKRWFINQVGRVYGNVKIGFVLLLQITCADVLKWKKVVLNEIYSQSSDFTR